MDTASTIYASAVAERISVALGPESVGVYLHGSGVLGGFDARRSDVDIVAVCTRPVGEGTQTELASRLRDDALPCPAQGLELSVVTQRTALAPTARPPFELHVTTAVHDSKVVDGHRVNGDADLLLHFAVCRSAGQVLGVGSPVEDVFGPVPEELVLRQLDAELAWSETRAANEYAVLNACRAWRFAHDRALVSKVDGGEWALSQLSDSEEANLVQAAMKRQLLVSEEPLDRRAVHDFVQHVRGRLLAPLL